MPNIPAKLTPTIESAPVRPRFLELPVGDVGEGIAAGVEALGRGAQQAARSYEKYKAEADVTAVQNAETLLDRKINEELYTGPNAYLRQKGERAVATHDEVDQRIEQERARLSSALTSDKQRELFERRVAVTLGQSKRHMATHLGSQVDTVMDLSDAAREDETLRRVSAMPLGEERDVDEAASMQRDYVLATAKRKGWDRATTSAALSQSEQKVAEARLSSYLAAKDGRGARRYFEAKRETLGVRASRYEAAVREAGLDEEAELRVGVLSKMATSENGRMDAGMLLEQVEASKVDSDLKAKMRSLATSRASSAEHTWNQGVRDTFNRASAAYEKRHSLADVDPMDAAWLKSADNGAVHYWQALEDRARADVDYWRVVSTRPEKETPVQRLAEFELRADMVDHPEKYLAMTPSEFAGLARPKLSHQGFESIGQAFNGMRATAGKADPNAALPAAVEDTVLTMGREAGVFPKRGTKTIKLGDPTTWGEAKTPAGNASADVYLAVTAKLRKEAARYKAENGKPPPADYLQKMAAKELGKVRVTDKGLIWDSEKETAAVDAALAGVPARPVIPPQEATQIRAALKAQGLEETDENMARLFQAAHAAPVSAPATTLADDDPLAPLVANPDEALAPLVP